MLIAVSLFVLVVAFAAYFVVSVFTPHIGENAYLQSAAYRTAFVFANDAGLNVTNITKKNNLVYVNISTNWETALENGNGAFVRNGNVTRIGLAKEAPVKSGNYISIPCCLSPDKVKVFFNNSTWIDVVGWSKKTYLENLSKLIGLEVNVGYDYSHRTVYIPFNISIEYLNGTPVSIDGVKCQIGEPIPTGTTIYKFERLVVIYNSSKGVYDAKDIRKLVVVVW